jgi:sugar phosphate isomerase/epimerase
LFEFANPAGAARRPYEILAESTDPSLVGFQMDLCWITAAGERPLTYFRRYPGRFVSAHVKDLKRIPPRPPRRGDVPDRNGILPDVADVGQGVIDWKLLLPQCWLAGIRHYFVEHDVPSEPLASAERSYRYLDKFTFEAAR